MSFFFPSLVFCHRDHSVSAWLIEILVYFLGKVAYSRLMSSCGLTCRPFDSSTSVRGIGKSGPFGLGQMCSAVVVGPGSRWCMAQAARGVSGRNWYG